MKQLLHHHEVRRATRFGIVGVANTAIDFIIFTTLVHFFQLPYLWANVVAFSVASLNSYIVNRRWTFRSSARDIHREALQYIVVLTIGFFINEGVLYLVVEKTSAAPLIGKLMATGISLIWNFLANRFWTFKGAVENRLAE
jgi:putative flippase GtrA